MNGMTQASAGQAVRLADVVRPRPGNSKLIKGKLPSHPGPGLYPAFSASGQDTYAPVAEHMGNAVVVSAVGARCGKCFLASGQWSAIANTHVLLPDESKIDVRFLWYRVNDERFWTRGGSAQPFVRVRESLEREILLPPLKEQREIVAELEKQFSRLDEAVANLKRVKANLKRCKAAILEAAVEGRLVPTEAEIACREGRSYETGSQLLGRVLQERRRAWNGRGTYRDPEAPGIGELPHLPEGWAWARLEAIAALKGGITVDKKRRDPTSRPVPYLRVANVQRGHLDLEEVKEIEAPEADIEELRLRSGDVLFNEGGDRDKLGRGWIWEGQLPECIHQNHVFRARPYLADMSGKLISWWGNTFGKDYFLREGKQTTNLASINMTKLSAFPVPAPPPAEQRRIVAEVDRRLSIVREVEAEVDANLKRAQALRQAVLARAFGRALSVQQASSPASCAA